MSENNESPATAATSERGTVNPWQWDGEDIIALIAHVHALGAAEIRVATPWALGNSAEAIVVNLEKVHDAGIAVIIVPKSQR